MKLDVPFMDYVGQLKIKTEEGKKRVWDDIRKKWYILQPEEFVRQLVVLYLTDVLGYNKNKIQLEKGFVINGFEKRFDILIYDNKFQPYLLVECKRPEVKIEQKVFDQISIYNIELKVPFLLVTNGPDTYCCEVDLVEKNYSFLGEIPKGN